MGIRIILWLIVGSLFYWMMSKIGSGSRRNSGSAGKGSYPIGQMVEDPVCGMFIDPKTSIKSRFKGKSFYFCSSECKEKFDKQPMK